MKLSQSDQQCKLLFFDTSPSVKSHLRLCAGTMYMKLIQISSYTSLSEPKDMELLALLVQDPVYHVRQTFIDKLLKSFATTSVSVNYIMLLALVAHEPEAELKAKVSMV